MPTYLKYENIFFLHFDLKLDPGFFSTEPDPDPGSVEKISDPHPWLPAYHIRTYKYS